MLVDAHCHLDQIDDAAQAVEDASSRGVRRILTVTEDAASMSKSLELQRLYPDHVVVGLGIHPVPLLSMSSDQEEEELSFLRENLESAIAIGEIGLDYKYAITEEDQARQLENLHRQFELAAEASYPVNLHSRRCERQVMNEAIAFHQRTGLNALLHWFTHSKKLIRITNEAGIYVSAGPRILHDDHSMSVASLVREDLLLLETDSPVSFEGRPARPDWIRDVCDDLAKALEITPEELEARTTENFLRYLGPSATSRLS